MFRLESAIQTYQWGKVGKKSKVAVLKASESGSEIDEKETYAELWLGTHPNGPSRVVVEENQGPLLADLLEARPEYLGSDLDRSGEDLPFMFKVLSIRKALSIQAHPDKATAERLHATRPELYKDDNHKPEMAVVLTDFEGLCGFRPYHEILINLFHYPELRGMVSLSAVKRMCSAASLGDEMAKTSALRRMFESFVKARPTTAKTQLAALIERIQDEMEEERGGLSSPLMSPPAPAARSFSSGSDVFSSNSSIATDASATTDSEVEDSDDEIERLAEDVFGSHDEHRFVKLRKALKEDAQVRQLILRLHDEYPGDIGVMMPLLLNHLRLGKGESFFMGANEPHAYLCGDLLEVMARSDNVVRVALTPKYCDVPLLCDMLSYEMGPPPMVIPFEDDECKRRYTPPIEDFELEDITVQVDMEPYTMSALRVPQLIICLAGSGVISAEDGEEQKVWPGVSFFVKAEQALVISCDSSGDGGSLRLTTAHSNTHFYGPQAYH